MYTILSLVILSVPLAIYFYLFASSTGVTTKPQIDVDGRMPTVIASFLSSMVPKSIPANGWVALSQLATLLLFTHLRVNNAVSNVIQANTVNMSQSVHLFFKKLTDTVQEVQKIAEDSSAGSDFQAMLTASPVEGISVTDLWAAHSARKAWAVKGANMQCKNGQVVMILGAKGKTRLLTSIAERIFVPPKLVRTTIYVRGSIKVAGVDLSKWDHRQLRKRVGVSLNDVRTVSDYAQLCSELSLEEILEPDLSPEGGGNHLGPKQRNSVAVAMKITGLSNSVLSHFPSKLSTVVSANEDELKSSPLRPSFYPLSPSDWSRVLLTKTLAQLIAGNEQQLSSPDNIKQCLSGSILLLDDATCQMSEADEAQLISSLRRAGAAVLLTSNRWASGRFADRLVVMGDKGGVVVESGTHNDLINLGPERSLYARQWNKMMSG